jgi:hypothetical protein
VQGASALQDVLSKTSAQISLFVVWEPVLRTDIRSPNSKTLGRLSDGRVQQFWDKRHLVSAEMSKALESKPSKIPLGKRRTGNSPGGILWDAVAVFSPGARWEETMPSPEYLDGIVVDVIGEVEARLTEGAQTVTAKPF